MTPTSHFLPRSGHNTATKRPSVELDRERRELGPRMLGAQLDDMVTVLRAYMRGEFDAHDRFPIVACAAQAFGKKYIESRAGRQRELAKQRAEGDTLLAAIARVVKHAGIRFADGTTRVILTANELFDAAVEAAPDQRAPKGWPTTPLGVTQRIGRNVRTLEAFGVTRETKPRKTTTRYTELVYKPGTEKVEVPAPTVLSDEGRTWREEQGKPTVTPFGLDGSGDQRLRNIQQLTRRRASDVSAGQTLGGAPR